MDFTKLGNTGMEVSRICLGCIDAVDALSVTLTQEEVAYLEEPYVPHPIVGHQ